MIETGECDASFVQGYSFSTAAVYLQHNCVALPRSHGLTTLVMRNDVGELVIAVENVQCAMFPHTRGLDQGGQSHRISNHGPMGKSLVALYVVYP